MDGTFRGCLRHLKDDRRGTVAAAFGVLTVPIMLATGAAVDYSRAANLRAKLQAATDAAALSVGAYVGEKTDTEIRAIAEREFNAVIGTTEGRPRLDEVQPIVISEGRSKLTVRSVANYTPIMMRFPPRGDILLAATSQTTISNDNYEIALVFDNSGSMSESAGGKTKLDAAKVAAKKLIDIMYGNDRSAKRTKMSLVPFTLSVNAGKDASGFDYSTAGWVDTAGLSPIHWGANFTFTGGGSWTPTSRFDLFRELDVTWRGCFEARPDEYGVTDKPASAVDPRSLFVPMFAPDEPGPKDQTRYYLNTGDNKGSGTNYQYDNSYLRDTGGVCTASAPSTNAAGRQAQICKYKINKDKSLRTDNGATRGPNRNCDAKPLLRLTNDTATLKANIDSMVASGNTNLLEGFMWGWRTVSPSNPFGDGVSYADAKTQKIIILLTDGQNVWNSASNHNKSIWSPFAYYINERLGTGIGSTATATTAMDNKTLTACNNARTSNVKVYTVGFSVKSGDVNRTLLEKCATTPTMAYIATNSSQIEKVFEEIAASIGSLRLSQ